MVNFVEAYKAGLNSAELAEKRKSEINSVFNDLNKQLAEETNGKIVISRKEFVDYKDFKSYALSSLEPKYYSAIAAENPFVKNSRKELAKWSQDRAGYPCKIILDSKTIYCEDKQGLENAIAELLRDPVVGEILYKLQNLPITEQANTEAPADMINSDASNRTESEE